MPADSQQVFAGRVHGDDQQVAIDDDRRGLESIENIVSKPAGAGR
jgi:hypothetical protein